MDDLRTSADPISRRDVARSSIARATIEAERLAKQEESDLIDHIAHVRAGNNVEWMMILRIALEEAPERTREVLRRIGDNDSEIQRLLRELGKE